ncbi:MAG TPA: crotonase/enoyl-CoA hydratase family protein [Solirubrobacteraceae bacterium]|jgi:enoyl-CoA hydratase
MSELATYELDGRIATITLDDGKVNAFSIAMLRAIHGALDEAERDGAVVVLRGREGYFSAGFDLKVFGGGDVAQVLEMLNLGATLAERLLSFKTPVVIASTGHTVAAGAFLLLAADCRIGTDGPFQIGLNEVKIGLTVPWFVIELARQRLHPAHFSRAVVCANMYGPREAVGAGFLDRVVAAEELREASLEEAARLAELNAAAHTATKLRARAATLAAMRSAIESELTVEGLSGESAPA